MFYNRPAMQQEAKLKIPKNQIKTSELQKEFTLIRDSVQKSLLTKSNNDTNMDADQLNLMIEESFNRTLEEEKILYNHSTREFMLQWVTSDIIGYGPIEP